jgi:hypothetical protein
MQLVHHIFGACREARRTTKYTSKQRRTRAGRRISVQKSPFSSRAGTARAIK